MPDTSHDLVTDPLLSAAPLHQGYRVLGGVVLYQRLGKGGMGAVYKGRHLRLDLDVAVKVMVPPAGLSPAHSQAFVQRFLREARTAASISHTNLVRVIDVNVEGGTYYLVMDYVDGESAAELLHRKGPLAENEAVAICLGAAEGLSAAHSAGIVHRDVKPDNILVDKAGRVVVADLGLAKAFTSEEDTEGDGAGRITLTLSQQVVGTPAYLSPEQTRTSKSVGPQSDVWSLGVTLYRLLTGSPPWRDTDLLDLLVKIRGEPAPDPRGLRPELSEGVAKIILRAMSKDPGERYGDCRAMASALREHSDRISDGTLMLLDVRTASERAPSAAMTPPAAQTISLIAGMALESTPGTIITATPKEPAEMVSARPARTPPARPRRWLVPLLAAAGGLILIALLLLLPWGSNEPAPPDPLVTEAEVFYQRQSEAVDAGRFEEASAAFARVGGKYDATPAGDKIRQLRSSVDAQLDKIRAEAERKRAAYDAAIRAADEAEARRDLKGAIERLREADSLIPDAAVKERIARLQRNVERDGLVETAEALERSGDLAGACAKYEAAAAISDATVKSLLLARIPPLKKRIELDAAVAGIAQDVEAGRWKAAWGLLEEARKASMTDARLDQYRNQVITRLAPQPDMVGPLGIEFVLVPGKQFRMGSDSGEPEEKPVHAVTLSSYYISRHEVTTAQYEAYRQGMKVARFSGAALPVVSVAWRDAVSFCGYLTKLDERAAYRLPTEAEWEFVARAGGVSQSPWGDTPVTSRLANLGLAKKGAGKLLPVGSLKGGAAPFGVFDLIGNAAEWCGDWYGPYEDKEQTDPVGPASGTQRIVRGGAYEMGPVWARATTRGCRHPDKASELIGIRVVRELTDDERHFERLAHE